MHVSHGTQKLAAIARDLVHLKSLAGSMSWSRLKRKYMDQTCYCYQKDLRRSVQKVESSPNFERRQFD